MSLRVLSLGGGVQSTTLALMAAHGEVPMPDVVLYALTPDPEPVHEHIRWLGSGNVLPFPVVTVSAGDMLAEMMAGIEGGSRFSGLPFHGRGPDGKPVLMNRQCTQDYKLDAIRGWVRGEYARQTGKTNPTPGFCRMQIGISWDEVLRVAPSPVQYIVNEHPLIELRMRRWDCLRWLDRHGYDHPPKSACVFCPFRRDAEWRWLRENDPSGFETACRVDDALRANGRIGGFTAEVFLHRSLIPLRFADLRSDEERGQRDWVNECSGVCGV